MKKIALIALAAVMALAFTACASEPPIDQPVASSQTIDQVNDDAMLVTPQGDTEAAPAESEPEVTEGTASMVLAESDAETGSYKLKFLTVSGGDEGLEYNFTGEEGVYALSGDATVMLPYVMDDYSIPDMGDLVEWEPGGLQMFFDAWRAGMPDVDPMFTVRAEGDVITSLEYYNIP